MFDWVLNAFQVVDYSCKILKFWRLSYVGGVSANVFYLFTRIEKYLFHTAIIATKFFQWHRHLNPKLNK